MSDMYCKERYSGAAAGELQRGAVCARRAGHEFDHQSWSHLGGSGRYHGGWPQEAKPGAAETVRKDYYCNHKKPVDKGEYAPCCKRPAGHCGDHGTVSLSGSFVDTWSNDLTKAEPPPAQPTKPHLALFENGSSRSERKPPYHLIPFEALEAYAERMRVGWEAHGEVNWLRGGPRFFAETQNHLAEHLLRYISGDRSEDHLGAVLANTGMLIWWDKAGRAAWEAREK